jgi:hypothetical protein
LAKQALDRPPPLLAGARVRAVKQTSSQPKTSFTRARAKGDWRALMGMGGVVEPAEAPGRLEVARHRRRTVCPRMEDLDSEITCDRRQI